MPLLSDLLAFIDSRKRVIGRNLSDLVNDPLSAIQKTVAESPKTISEYFSDPMNFVGGGVGKIAWHGSPHKFDAFDLSKIGTGEGAQAYGHGAYLAEAKDVADQYRVNLSYDPAEMKIGGRQINDYYNNLVRKADRASDPGDLYDKAGIVERLMANEPVDSVESWANGVGVGDWFRKEIKPNFGSYGQLYKTDIPDESISRFLDWDKPLSQQAPEVQKALQDSGLLKYSDEYFKTNKNTMPTGGDLHNFLKYSGYSQPEITGRLAEQGIPGVRYLDAGSRGTGGTSNYVIFDPAMIRILERNNVPTGAKPWAPGEWGG